jgi:predicted short-subunit dehydrogenase-like oxidoreductase (DUF2520 family)
MTGQIPAQRDRKMPPRLSIIGSGHVASTLGRLWHGSQCVMLLDVLSRSNDNARAACEFIGAGRALQDYAALEQADIYLIATPDDQIAACCALLANSGRILTGTVVFHCSGALPASVLQPALACGALVASVHPVRSFALPEQVAASFAGTWCGMEGDAQALAVVAPLFEAIGAHCIAIDPGAKTIYHAAAVFASNYLVTVIDVALQAYGQAGVPREVAMKLMEPLVRKTVDQVFEAGTAAALSGPIARGDMATVERQARALTEWNQGHGSLYRCLAQATLRLAGQRKR